MYLGQLVEVGPSRARSSTAPPTRTPARCSRPCSEPDPRKRGDDRRSCCPGEIPSPRNPPPGCRFHTRCAFAQPRSREEVPELEEIEPQPRRRLPLLAQGADGRHHSRKACRRDADERADRQDGADHGRRARLRAGDGAALRPRGSRRRDRGHRRRALLRAHRRDGDADDLRANGRGARGARPSRRRHPGRRHEVGGLRADGRRGDRGARQDRHPLRQRGRLLARAVLGADRGRVGHRARASTSRASG